RRRACRRRLGSGARARARRASRGLGAASFSLHGWIWRLMAIGGTFAGLALRPVFGLTNPKPTDSVC
ncbi:MAG TPA: hypothetical protein VLB03_05490, partial [Nocardioidaceae bacterium]|nr:hypothetical protein [Nocardioidaceae bacterium]